MLRRRPEISDLRVGNNAQDKTGSVATLTLSEVRLRQPVSLAALSTDREDQRHRNDDDAYAAEK